MRCTVIWLSLISFVVASESARAEGKTALVESIRIQEAASGVHSTDLVQFNDQWFCVFSERETGSPAATLRVVTSADARSWQTAARIPCIVPNRGWPSPRLVVTPDNQLMLVAMGSSPVTPSPDAKVNAVQSWMWTSKDGREWNEPSPFAERHYIVSSVRSFNGRVFSFSRGCICGNSQSVEISSGQNTKHLVQPFNRHFSGFFPGDGSLIFTREFAYCLMTRSGKTGLVGTSSSPFDEWSWKDLGTKISHPNLLQLRDGRIIASVGLSDEKSRTSLCWFDDTEQTLSEILELPVNGRADTGLVWHDGHLWVSYHVPEGGGSSVHLAKVEIPKVKI